MHEQGFALDKLKTEIHMTRQTLRPGSVQPCIRNLFFNSGNQTVPHGLQTLRIGFPLRFCQFDCLAHTDNAGNILRTGSMLVFLCAAVHKGLQTDTLADIQRADALRTIEFMRAHRQHIDVHRLYIDWQRSDGLHGIHMEQISPFSLQTAPSSAMGLMVPISLLAIMMRDQDGLVIHCLSQCFHRYLTVLIHRKVRYADSFFLQVLAGVQNRMMLYGRGNDVIALYWHSSRQCSLRPSYQPPFRSR